MAVHKVQNKKDFFVFGMSENNTKVSEAVQVKQKMENYWDFIFRINFTNDLYVCARDEEKTLKCFVGFGNNAAIIKGVMRRRFWWTITDKIEEAHFAWTQLKVEDLFKRQRRNIKETPFQKKIKEAHNS